MSLTNRPGWGGGPGSVSGPNDPRARRAVQQAQEIEQVIGDGLMIDKHGRLNVDVSVTRGEPGEQGAVGPSGVAGTAGVPGAVGSDGVDGLAGAQGPTGATGPQGEVGSTGAQGEAGPQGPQGIQGPPGDTGNRHDVAIAELAAPSQLHDDDPTRWPDLASTKLPWNAEVNWKTQYALDDGSKRIARDWRPASTYKTFGAPEGPDIDVPIWRYGDKAGEGYSDPTVLGFEPGFWKCAFEVAIDGPEDDDNLHYGLSFQRVNPGASPETTEYDFLSSLPVPLSCELWKTQGYNNSSYGTELVSGLGSEFKDYDLISLNEADYVDVRPRLTGYFLFASAAPIYVRCQAIKYAGGSYSGAERDRLYLRSGQLICERWERIQGG